MRLALAQVAPRAGCFEANLRAHLDALEQAKRADADVLVFGELSLSGYGIGRDEAAQWRAERFIGELAGAAAGVTVIAGAPFRGGGRSTNAAIVLAGGELVHRQDKLNLPSYGPFDEAERFAAGSALVPFDLLGWRSAILICEDAWRATVIEAAARAGVELAIHIAASAEAHDGVLAGNRSGWPLVNAAQALLFGRYVAFVNLVGEDDGLAFWGGSAVYRPDGTELDSLGGSPGVVVVELDRALMEDQRRRLPINVPSAPSRPE
jgi:predicted amidohydrolase